ncbi:TPA: beta strand repeat-containing protein, partial [Salmonella enterica subsp. enterica serovar Reading]
VVLTGTAGSQVGVNVSNTTVSAGSGNLTVNGNSASGLGVALNGSHLSGGNVTVNGNVSGGAGAGVSLNSATVSAVSGNITMSGKGKDSSNGSLSVTGNNTFSAENTVLSGEAGRNNKGVVLGNNASSVTNISVTRGNLTVSGMVNRVNAGDSSNIYTGLLASNLNVSVSCGSLNMAGNMAGSYAGDTPVAMNLTNVTLSADNDVTLNGSTVGGGTGAKLNNVTVSATAGNIALNGSVAQGGGTGVSLTSGKMTASSGNVSVTGTSAAGNGVSLNGTTATGNNVTVTGTITSGNGNAGIEVKGGSSLTATNQQGNLTLTGTKTGGGDGYGIHISGGNTLTAGDTITLNGTVMDGKDGALNVDTNTFSAQNTVLSGTSSRNNIGVKAGGNINVTKGNLTVTGVANRINSAPSVSGLMSGVNLKIDVQNGYLNITGNINDTGHNATSANTATGLKLSNATLKASQDVSLNAEMNGSTDGNAMILSGGNITAGENIALHGTVTEGNGSGVSLSGTGMTAGNGDITVSGNGYDAAKGGLNVNGGNFSAQKTVLTGTAKRNNKGAVLSGNINVMQGNLVVTGTTNQVSGKGWVGLQATGNINVSAGDLSLTGSLTGTDGSGTTALNLTGVNLSAQNMVLNGTNSNSGSGLVLNNATLNATTASLKGSAANSGSGFVLNNITLEGGIAQGSNMTFSSEGSGANVTNTLNVNGGLGYGAFEAMQQAGIDNNTSIGALTASLEDMKKYMNFSKDADWTFSADSLNTSAAAGKAGSWLVTGLTGIDATTNGSISLTGMNLTNSNLSGSSLTLQGGNNASLTLQNTNLTATSGNVSLSANVANGSALVVTGGNITASGDISVNGTTGGAGTAVQVSGGCMTASGNLAVTGTSAARMGVALNGSQLSGGNVAVMGTTASGNKGMEVKGGSVLTATNAQGNLTLTGTKTGVGNGYGIHIFGGNTLTAGETITLNGTAVDGNDGALNVDTNTFSAQNTVLTGTSSRNNIGVKAGGNINVTKGNLTVTGNMYHRNNGAFTGLQAQSGLNISVSSGNLTLTGQALEHPEVTDGCVSVPSGNVVGLNLTGVTLSANQANLKGDSVFSGSGFILNNVTLSGNIARGNNMTFSSEGSGANITNTLNVNGGLGYGAFQKIRQAGIDNNTSVLVTADADDLKLMGLNDSNSDWTFNASQAGEAAGGKAGEWGLSFTGIDATTNGSISLTGMNLTNSNLTGSSLTMQGANNGSLTVQNSNLTASTGNISLSTTNGTLTVSNVNLSSGGGHTTLSGTSEQSNGTGVKLGGNVSVTKGELTVNGTGNLKGIDAGNASVSLTSGALTMNGMVNAADSSSSSVGLDLSGSSTVLNATSANLTGVNRGNGYGFLLNAGLQGGLTTTGNLTLSSHGSGVNVTNQIGNRIDSTVVKYMVEHNTDIGSMTEVGINNLYKQTDFDGWINNGSLTKSFGDFVLPFSGISISTGSINLTGASFTGSTLTATSGNLTIDNGPASLNLSGSTLNASEGAVSLTGGKGVNLTNGNISAQNDITINASHGGVIISGAGNNEPDRANITSTSGNISVFGHNPGTGKVTGVTLTNVSLNASQGNITVNGTTPGIWSGVRLTNVSMTADMNKGYIDVYAESQGFGDTYDERGSLYFGGKGGFSAANLSFTGVNRRAGSATPSYNGAYNSAGIVFDQYSNVSFSGNTTLNATGGKGMAVWGGVSLGFSNGISAINAKAEAEGGDGYFGQGAIFFNNFYDNPVLNLSVNNGDLNITANSEGLKDVAAFNMADMGTNSGNGIKLSGSGNITLTGKSDGSTGLSAGMFNNEQLTGHLTINGQSSTGTGVLVNSSASSHLVNASINGISQTGTGLLVTTSGDSSVNLNGNTLTGTSGTGTGININGN